MRGGSSTLSSERQDQESFNIFRLLRIARNRKVKDLAEELNVTPGYINLIEKGAQLPSLQLLYKYAETLDVPAELLISFKPEKDTSQPFEKTMLKLLKIICKDEENDS